MLIFNYTTFPYIAQLFLTFFPFVNRITSDIALAWPHTNNTVSAFSVVRRETLTTNLPNGFLWLFLADVAYLGETHTHTPTQTDRNRQQLAVCI